MKKYQFKIHGNEYEVNIKDIEDQTVELEVNGTPYTVEMKQEVKKTKTPKLVRSKTPPPSTKEHKPLTRSGKLSTIKSPLPGKIFSIDVSEGDTVKKNDKLMVLEAMKMENNILSDVSGTVKSIKVEVGENVGQDAVLAEIEEEA